MTSFTRRRIGGLTFLVVSSCSLWLLTTVMSTALQNPATLTGWILFLVILLLAGHGLRKKLPQLPLGSMSGWLQVHIYVALLSLPLFLLHTQAALPRGPMESCLTMIFVTTFISGVAGLMMTRRIPPKLTSRGPEIIFSRIPASLKQLREEAERCAVRSQTGSGDAISELYLQHLDSFFQRPRNFLRHVLQSQTPRTRLLNHLQAARRFVKPADREVIDRLAELICRKDDLDYQYSLQWLLQSWQFVHLPTTVVLIVVSILHIVVARAF